MVDLDRRGLGILLVLFGCTHAVESPSAPTLLATQSAPVKVARDFDSDGALDPTDRCPLVAGAVEGCPDSDGDGVEDRSDPCPNLSGPENGCPIPDTDGDALLDPDDRCVDKPETKNGFEDGDGCPEELPADLVATTGIIRGVKFDLDKDTIKPAAKPVLDQAVAVLKKYAEVRIEISGHTDSTGYVGRTNLSGRRAAAVKRYLVEHGILEARIETRGAGMDEPIDTNKTAAGRAKNRRIEFTILYQ